VIYQSFTCIEKIVKLLSQIDYTIAHFHPPNIKLYIFNLIPSQHVSSKPIIVLVTIDHQMVVIQVQVGRNFIEDVLLTCGFGVNIIMGKLRELLRLPKPTPYNLCMANQTNVKPLGLMKNLKFFVHGIVYTITFTVIQNNVLESSYFMLLSSPWLKYAKVFLHD